MMGGFYPRSVMGSYHSPHIFYLKFPVSVVTLFYGGNRNLEIVSVKKVLNRYIRDEEWQIVVGKETFIIFTHCNFTEFAVRPNNNISQLHTISLNKTIVFPVKYEISTNTAYFQHEDGSIEYIRLGQSAADSQYYTLNISKQNDLLSWDVSGSWLLTDSDRVYYQFQQPSLII